MPWPLLALIGFAVTLIEEATGAARALAWQDAGRLPPMPWRRLLRTGVFWRAVAWSGTFEAVLFLGMLILVWESSLLMLLPFCLGAMTGTAWTLFRRLCRGA